MSGFNGQIIVQKYGGATLSSPQKIKDAARRIFELKKSGAGVVVVVSAMGKTTNDLIKLANEVSPRPPLRELDMLLTVGERISMSLLSMALNDLGAPAISFTGSQAGIITDDLHVNANIIDIRANRVEDALKDEKIVILAGFQGVSGTTKEITTLGRGGSDITAVAMAGYLKANRCEILKDVDAVFTADPNLVPTAKPINKLNYLQLSDMTRWGAKVLNYRSVKFAESKDVTLFVGPANAVEAHGTVISKNVKTENHTGLAISNFSKVYKLTLKNNRNFSEFLKVCSKNQIGELDLIYSSEEFFYVTAADEILNSLEDFVSRQNEFSIVSKNLCCVTLTMSDKADSSEFKNFQNKAFENNFRFEKQFNTDLSHHIILSSDFRPKICQMLHDHFIAP